MSFNLVQVFWDVFSLMSDLEIMQQAAGFAAAALVGALTWKLILPQDNM